jgi:hypothetical protein
MNVLGYDTIGANLTGTYTAPAQLGCKFTASGSDTFDNVMVWLQAGSVSGDFKVALYSDSAGSPDALLYSSAGSGVLTTTGAWVSCPMSGSVVSGTTYWILVSCDTNFLMPYDGGGSNQTFDDYTAYPTFNNPYGVSAPDNYYAAVISIYLDRTITTTTIKGLATIKGIATLKL